MTTDVDNLTIINYPDPRLRKVCEPITEFDGNLAALAAHMLKLMKAAPGVGLAAPQVGILRRLFVANVTGEPDDDWVFVNPQIHDGQGAREAEEGCLSIPDVHVQVRRALRCRITAQDLGGKTFTLEGEDLPARVWQHEVDHLDGKLIIDRMGPADQIATRKQLKELESRYSTRRA